MAVSLLHWRSSLLSKYFVNIYIYIFARWNSRRTAPLVVIIHPDTIERRSSMSERTIWKKIKREREEREGKNSESAGSCIFYPRPAHLFPFLFLLFVLLCYNGNSIRGPGGSEGFVSNSIEAAANVQSSGGIRETAEIAASLRARAAQISYENSNV